MKGVATAFDYTQGQPVSGYNETIAQTHHVQLTSNNLLGDYYGEKYGLYQSQLNFYIANNNTGGSASDLIFLGSDPVGAKTCGLTEVVFDGHLEATCYKYYGPYEIGDITTTVCIPWFISP
ncbi:MAG: hypothetical protein WCD81_10110 [Candidatus Bathyarchaeia archaeon]